jgi:hypothetical protein
VSAVLGTKATVAREAIASLTGSSLGPLELLEEVRTRVARVVPSDGSCWMLTDPRTVMPISLIRAGQTGPEFSRRYWEHEFMVPDFVPMAACAATMSWPRRCCVLPTAAPS